MSVRNLTETIEGCLNGCCDAWRVLFEEHAVALYHISRGMGAPVEMSEDIVGDVFLQLIEDRGECLSRARFADALQLRRWLVVLAKRRYLDVNRHERAGRFVETMPSTGPETIVPSDAPEHEDVLLRTIDAHAEVELALTLISVREQLLIKLFYLDELRLREIADLMEAPVGTVSASIARAREKMRRGMPDGEPVRRSMIEEAPSPVAVGGSRQKRHKVSDRIHAPVEVHPA